MNFWENDVTADSRPYVMELQSYLRALEREKTGTTAVPQDGFYGTATTAGVLQFQQSTGLPATGTVDRVTWEALFAAYEALRRGQAPPLYIRGLRQPTLIPGDQGDAVLFLNIMLGLGDAAYTAATQEAVRAVQQSAFLPVTGNTDKATWDAVVRLYNQGGTT
ncbi:MAG: hypothetical protein E7527_02625 [Ruminococcaceae bacterium]|nr:hypothetical protein [Oscillospiraceae bacterium]